MDNHITQIAKISDLKPHPRNYRKHPEDQLKHIAESIKQHGMYRNIIIANDNTVLAGHGVLLACQSLGKTDIPVVKLTIGPDEPAALKILAGDNEISNLGEIDDRALSEMLKEVKDLDELGLLGTGYDEMMLANLVMVTRPANEIKNIDEAAAWVGMPDYQEESKNIKIVVSFLTETDRAEFLKVIGSNKNTTEGKTLSIWWPDRERDDPASVIVEAKNEQST